MQPRSGRAGDVLLVLNPNPTGQDVHRDDDEQHEAAGAAVRRVQKVLSGKGTVWMLIGFILRSRRVFRATRG